MALLSDKIVLITGSGIGIGREAAKIFSREGAHVMVGDLNQENGESTVEQVERAGGSASFVRLDVTNEDSVDQAISQIIADHGRLDVLYNNAGGSAPTDNIVTELDIVGWEKAQSVDLFGTFLTCRRAIKEMVKAGSGAVVNTTSLMALKGSPHRHAYSAAKGGVISMTRAMAVTYGPMGVRVNAVSPGLTQTERVRGMMEQSEMLRESASECLLGPGEPEDIANAALFLASDMAKRITGIVVPVDSGISAS